MSVISCSAFRLGRQDAAVSATSVGLKVAVDKKPALVYRWADVLGASAGLDEGIGATSSMPLVVHVLEKTKGGKRKLRDVVLTSAAADNGIHQMEVDKWVRIVQYFADPRRDANAPCPTLDEVMQHSPRQRTFLVLINPAGGSGKAEKIYDKVESFLVLANVRVEKIVTERPHHALDVAEHLDLVKYDCLVIVGGDGLVYEVVQGFMKRLDWAAAIQFPLGILPAGSGNGLAKSICEAAGEISSPESCMYLSVKGRPVPLDVATLRNASTTCYLVLSLTWGFMAEIDYESEKYRFFGGQRFVVGTLVKLLAPKTWNGTFSYLESTADDADVPRFQASDSPAPELSVLPPLGTPVPPKWKTIEGPMSMFWAMNVSHASTDAHIAPPARLDDGFFHVVVMEGKASRGDYAGVMLGLEKGQHVDQPAVQLIKTRAFQLQTPDEHVLMADGERCDGGTWQVEVHRGMARVMSVMASPP
ncbi:sphingosine kinase [Achlya hypogyna]|uniref:Sphingosine kinase n=1 Tax=Achlya hypogyna TaxID=1202772 RepID=A0A1V9YZZ0_ACHHY|nr:sphingosine kinase [Achlya hypogyna]